MCLSKALKSNIHSEPHVNCGLYVIIMYQCWLIAVLRIPHYHEMLIRGDTVYIQGEEEDIWELFVRPVPFFCKPETV